MKLIRLAVLSIVILFFVVFAISLFIPSHIRISRAVNMRTSSDEVLNQISDINKWKEWYPGFDTLKLQAETFKNGRMVSAVSSSTAISIFENSPGEVKAEFKSGTRKPVISGWQAISYNNSDSLTLQWYLDFKLRWYPWEKFFGLTYDKMYGIQMEEGLQRLKKNVER